MKTIKVFVSTGYVGSERSDTFEVEDNATKEEISKIALEVMYEMIDFGWQEVTEGGEDV